MYESGSACAVDDESVEPVGQLASAVAEIPTSWEQRLEESLERFLPSSDAPPQPLHRAMRYAVFSGGKRLRPKLVLLVATACGANREGMEMAMRIACAVELVHSASLVHDDLPCFDDAAERRGQPTVHVRFGEAMAVLVGDALLTLAFAVLADAPSHLAKKSLQLVHLLGRATGSAFGIIGGQSLEQPSATCELEMLSFLSPEFIERYHQMKTGALFQLATEAGAVAAGAANPAAWARVGLLLGHFYQLGDDLLDVRGQAAALGKPVGQDAALGRPNALLCRGEEKLLLQLQALREAISQQVQTLAALPQPLLTLLDSLQAQLRSALA